MLKVTGVNLDFTGNAMFVTASETLEGATGPVENVQNRTVDMPPEVAALRGVIEAAYAGKVALPVEAVTSAVFVPKPAEIAAEAPAEAIIP